VKEGNTDEGTQELEWTAFNKIKAIGEEKEGIKDTMTFFYGPMETRKKVVYSHTEDEEETEEYTKYYSINYEREINTVGEIGSVRQVHYIYGGDGLAGVYILGNDNEDDGNGTMYYVLKDHLGSITGLVNEDGTIAEEYSYDAWGRRRNPDSWKPFTTQELKNFKPIISRGYTGHEHLDIFGLINMNGRLYDPINGRMLSPDDNEIDDFAQSYNRYSYCRNNPLRYTDQSGWQVWGMSPPQIETTNPVLLREIEGMRAANDLLEFWDNLWVTVANQENAKYEYELAMKKAEALKGGGGADASANTGSGGDPALEDYVEKLIWGDDAKTADGNPNSPLDPSNPQNNTTDPGCQETDLGFFYQGSQEETKELACCLSTENNCEVFFIETSNGYYIDKVEGYGYDIMSDCSKTWGYLENDYGSHHFYTDIDGINSSGEVYLYPGDGNRYQVYSINHTHLNGMPPGENDRMMQQMFGVPSYIWNCGDSGGY
jgi:RHS repeat-associated protein